jgi:heat shock protein HslJ
MGADLIGAILVHWMAGIDSSGGQRVSVMRHLIRYVTGSSPWAMRRATVVVGFVVLLVAGCGDFDPLDELPKFESGPRDITGTTWQAEEIADNAANNAVQSTISFNQSDQLSGKAGCNTFLGPYRLNGGKVTFGPFAMTRMICEPSATEQENAFMMALAEAAAMEVSGDTMYLRDTAGVMVLRLSLVE